LLLKVSGLGILPLVLTFHLVANCHATQGAECATNQGAFPGTVIAHCAANDRASTGAKGATTKGSFFPCR
jgi:hypothetical protein